MSSARDPFRESIKEQIALNQSRTPTERFLAMCDLLDVARAMAPSDPAARERRRRALVRREQEREQWRAQCRRWVAEQRARAAL